MMIKKLPFILGIFFASMTYAQNSFPTATGSSVILDGGNLNLFSPNNTSWARGSIFKNSSGATRIAGVGVFGERNKAERIFLGIGGTPWTSPNGMYILANGRVGIGTTDPTSRLDIRAFSANSKIILGTGQNSANSKLSLEFRHRYGTSGFGKGQILSSIRSERTGSQSSGTLIFSTAGSNNNASEKMRIQSNGNVGIGTKSPGNYKLAVNGKVRAKEVVIETGWSDFVFEKDYDLRSLEEVESYIEKNGHLPEIPSAEEVAKNGVKLGEMDSKLLMKIEELTLYLLEQDKIIKAQCTDIEHLKKQIELINKNQQR